VRERAPALVLTDVMLPRLDGFGLLRALRSDARTAGIPIIMLSARAGEESRVEGMEAGADDYVVKPFSARELLARVAAHLQMARMRRESNETLQKSEERFRAFVNASSDVVYRMSPDWSEMRFLEGREFISDTNQPSRSWLDKYIYPEDQQRVLRAVAEAIRTKTVFELEHRVLRVDGSLGWTFSRAIPLLDAQGGIVEWFGAAGDITARKQAEESLREADRRKDEFLATLSHELRNPLAPLRNGLQVMHLKGDDAKALAPVREIMERQLNHLVRLVDDLLEMSRITRGTFELRSERVELSTVVRNAVETSEPAIHAGGHRLDISLPAEALSLQGDPVRLAQILSNLLNNAAKYTDHGGNIVLSVRREGEAALISVRDNGQGISADGLTRIFEMFTREARGRSGDQGGLGIGLTLSRRLAEMHGGSIQAHSDGPGKGSEFVVRLPLARSPVKKDGAAKAPDLSLPMRVLVVDDNRDAAESLGMLLGALGATVQLAFDGPSAIEAFASSDPSIVLLDIGMPGMNGYEVARTLRARFPDRRVPIVALTGWGQEEDRRLAMAAGIDHHLVKPAEFEALSGLLSRLSTRIAAA
jgi:signal transduction histidine kinase